MQQFDILFYAIILKDARVEEKFQLFDIEIPF